MVLISGMRAKSDAQVISKEGSGIRIINEPLDSQSGGSAVFLVEMGKIRAPPETMLCFA